MPPRLPSLSPSPSLPPSLPSNSPLPAGNSPRLSLAFAKTLASTGSPLLALAPLPQPPRKVLQPVAEPSLGTVTAVTGTGAGSGQSAGHKGKARTQVGHEQAATMNGHQPAGSGTQKADAAKGAAATGAQGGDELGPGQRTGRACLACRKLKTRCYGADDPPCRRCRAGNHECVFVESKRGKRPVRKAPDASLTDKLKAVESGLGEALEKLAKGGLDEDEMRRLKEVVTAGVGASKEIVASSAPAGKDKDKARRESVASQKREASEEDASSSSNKRARQDSAFSIPQGSPSSSFNDLSTSPTFSTQQITPLLPTSTSLPSTSTFTAAPARPGDTLSLLADASLAAEISGTHPLTGLDSNFRLSSVTSALLGATNGPNGTGPESSLKGRRAPGILEKGIVGPATAVELFQIFFDYAYIHLPLLDPALNTATDVATRSPLLFTVICAVASRFHPDETLHVKCYDAAHEALMADLAAGVESSIESVQACLFLTVWSSAPKGAEDRPQRAWFYFGLAIRMALELGLWRAPQWVDEHLTEFSSKPNPWIVPELNARISEEKQREALDRERTWLLVFVIDRNISAVMGRPYQVHEARPLLLPKHPLTLPFDLGIIAHQQLQAILSQVMDSFWDRIFGLSSACREMPSPVVMKLFNSRMDEWRAVWCPVAGEPIANNLLFYFFSSKLFLNTFPLHTMLRNGDANEDPDCVNTCIDSAKSILDLGHKYAELGVLRHCPDVNFLLILFAACFLLKMKACNSRFSSLVDSAELHALLLQSVEDCRVATCSPKHAASSCHVMLKALLATWRKMAVGPQTSAVLSSVMADGSDVKPSTTTLGTEPSSTAFTAFSSEGMPIPSTSAAMPFSNPMGMHGTLAPTLPLASPMPMTYSAMPSPGGLGLNMGAGAGMQSSHGGPNPFNFSFGGGNSGAATPNYFSNSGMNMDGLNGLGDESLQAFLNDTNFTGSFLFAQGSEGFFSWPEGMESAVASSGLDGL